MFLKTSSKLVTAESCTGGLLSSLFTSISKSSFFFDRGYITYSDEAKIEDLGVKKETLIKFGAVSLKVATEMVMGVFRNTKSDICISITGISGPTGGTKEKPIGLVYIGFYYDKSIKIFKKNFYGNRKQINNEIVNFIVYYLLKYILRTGE